MNKRNLNPNESGNRVSYAPWFTFRLFTWDLIGPYHLQERIKLGSNLWTIENLTLIQ